MGQINLALFATLDLVVAHVAGDEVGARTAMEDVVHAAPADAVVAAQAPGELGAVSAAQGVGVLTADGDIFSFFAFWELMSSWALYVALVHEETGDARREAMKYFMFNTVGAGFMFLGIAMLGTASGSYEFSAIAQAASGMSVVWLGAAVVLVFLDVGPAQSVRLLLGGLEEELVAAADGLAEKFIAVLI